LGLRRPMLDALLEHTPSYLSFLEVAPENWIGVGGRFGKKFRALTERHPFIAHGLSLSLGGPSPLDKALIRQIRDFIETHQIISYSEHLSACSDGGHLYDLLPVPFNEAMVNYMADRIRQVQDMLGQRIAVENSSYYLSLDNELSEVQFIRAVCEQADCDLLLDINNLYVNSVNHGYDPEQFLQQVPLNRVRYFHVAGHYTVQENFIIDSHGASVIDPVWHLLGQAYQLLGAKPTLLERDFNFMPLTGPLQEVRHIDALMQSQQTPIDSLLRVN